MIKVDRGGSNQSCPAPEQGIETHEIEPAALPAIIHCACRPPAWASKALPLTRRAFGGSVMLGLGLTLAGCMAPFSGRPPGFVGGFSPDSESESIGDGDVRVALILPLSASGAGGAAARDLRNAAQLALEEFDDPAISLSIKDDRGSAEGAREAAREAIAEGGGS